MDMLAVSADPLRATRRRQRAGKPAFDHAVRRPLATLDRCHDGKNTRVGIFIDQIAQCAAGGRKILGRKIQLGLDQSGFAVIGARREQLCKALQALLGRLVRGDGGKGGGKIGMGLLLPCLANHARGIARPALGDITARRHHRCGNEMRRQFVRLDRSLARLDRLALDGDVAGGGQGQNSVAAFMNVAGNRAEFQFCIQG